MNLRLNVHGNRLTANKQMHSREIDLGVALNLGFERFDNRLPRTKGASLCVNSGAARPNVARRARIASLARPEASDIGLEAVAAASDLVAPAVAVAVAWHAALDAPVPTFALIAVLALPVLHAVGQADARSVGAAL
jgi:hypothetical protein